MRIAVWNEPAVDVFAAALERSGAFDPASILRGSRTECRDWLVRGEVDIALVPTLTVIREEDFFDPLPAVALSSWNYPFTEIVLHRGLGHALHTIVFDPRYAQDVLLARIVLKEHYNMAPGFKPVDTTSVRTLLDQEADAAVIVNQSIVSDVPEATSLDLGREWFELTNYPLIWGVFVAQKGAATPAHVRALIESAATAEQITESWIEEHVPHERFATFYTEHMRYRLDDLATASLTSLQDYLYYYLATDDIPSITFYQVPEEEEDSTNPRPLV